MYGGIENIWVWQTRVCSAVCWTVLADCWNISYILSETTCLFTRGSTSVLNILLGHFYGTRDLKQPRQRRQREPHKTIGLISSTILNSSACAISIFVHFLGVLCKTAMWNDQIQSIMENVNTRQWMFLSLSGLELHPRIQFLDSSATLDKLNVLE